MEMTVKGGIALVGITGIGNLGLLGQRPRISHEYYFGQFDVGLAAYQRRQTAFHSQRIQQRNRHDHLYCMGYHDGRRRRASRYVFHGRSDGFQHRFRYRLAYRPGPTDRYHPCPYQRQASRQYADRLDGGFVHDTVALPDGGTFTYSLVSGTGSDDNAAFTISGNNLVTAATFNAGLKSTYKIRVRTTDQVGLTFEKALTITLTDVTSPTVTINQQIGQADPTHVGQIYFRVVFSEPVTDFTAADVTLTGTAPGASVKNINGSGTTYEVQVSGMTASGTVIATIRGGQSA